MTGHHATERDADLGAALNELPVPEHDPGFDDRLHTLLVDERDAAQARAPRRRWFRLARPLLAGAVAAGVLTVVVAGLDEDAPGPLGPERATAAEVVARAQQALARATSLAGVLILRDREGPGAPIRRTRLEFALTDRGDVRILGGELGDIHYEARTGTQITLAPPGPVGAYVERGLAPGAPDPGPLDRVLQGELAAVARSLQASGDATVVERRVAGRPAYVLRRDTEVNKLGFSGDALEIAVDRATGLPLLVREELGGRLVRELRLRGVQVDRPLPRRAFRPPLPAGERTEIDSGFRRVTLERAASTTGYAPLVPRALPSGFRPAETLAARASLSTGSEGLNPPSRDVVTSAYRRGIDRVLVTTRSRGPRSVAWADPISAGEGNVVREEVVRLRRGALAGERARVVIDPDAVPHLWVLGERLVVTVSGPLTRAELVAAAESLQRVG